MDTEETIFDKIIRKEIPADVVYEDDEVLAFKDISPVAPVHVLLIPKKRGNLSQLSKAQEDDKALLGSLLYKASQIAGQMKLEKGYRIVINDGA